MIKLQLENVNYYYGKNTAFEKHALKDINLTVGEGEFIGLVGHTGSGKSTLIQHFNGLIKPSNGHVFWNDRDIHEKGYNRSVLCADIGVVFQYPEYQLFEVSVLKDVSFGPKNIGYSNDEAVDRAKEALNLVGLDSKYYEKSPFELSGGEKRRVAIAGVLAMNPKMIVLDEPAAALDPKGKKEILDLIFNLHQRQNMTIILSSHSMEDMATYAERLIVMDHGEIVMDDKTLNVFKSYRKLENIGLAAPRMMYIMKSLYDAGIDINQNILTLKDAKDEIMRIWRENHYDS